MMSDPMQQITYYPLKRPGMYVAHDRKGQVFGFVSEQTIRDRGEMHLIAGE